MPAKFGAVPVPAGVVRAFACDTPSFVLALAATGVVLASTCAANVLCCRALLCKMSPSPAFHALYGLELLLSWPDPGVAYDCPISDEEVSAVHR